MHEQHWDERVGLCSVTLRHLTPDAVVTAATDAGLRRIEWGADVHAPPGSDVTAVRDATTAAGLTVASYGTYWKAGLHRAVEGDPLLVAATMLGAPRLRVWAGDRGTDPVDGPAADADWWALAVDDLHELCERAADHGVDVALEFHPGTLTDTVATTRELLERVDHPSLSTYWQPPVGEATGPAVAGLRELVDVVSAVHVFAWWPRHERLPLVDRADLWTAVVDVLTTHSDPLDLLLEFVPDDDVSALAGEAATLRRWLVG